MPERVALNPGGVIVRSLPLPTGGDVVLRWSTSPPQLVVAAAVFIPSVAASPTSHTEDQATEGEVVVRGREGCLRITFFHVSTGWFYDAATTLTLHTSIEPGAVHVATEGAAHTEMSDEYTDMMDCAIRQVRASRLLSLDRERAHTGEYTGPLPPPYHLRAQRSASSGTPPSPTPPPPHPQALFRATEERDAKRSQNHRDDGAGKTNEAVAEAVGAPIVASVDANTNNPLATFSDPDEDDGDTEMTDSDEAARDMDKASQDSDKASEDGGEATGDDADDADDAIHESMCDRLVGTTEETEPIAILRLPNPLPRSITEALATLGLDKYNERFVREDITETALLVSMLAAPDGKSDVRTHEL
jgi:hypothetical protein